MPPFNSVQRYCLYCKKPFFSQPNQLKNGEGKYCSIHCKRTDKVKSPAQRLWEKVDKSGGEDACWPYATLTRDTYGNVGYDAGDIKWHGIGAHCLAYILTYGPYPNQMIIRHTCDNKPCCNPRHLVLGTHQDNMDDAASRHRMSHGINHHRAKLTEAQVQDIRRLRKQGMKIIPLSKQFHVSIANISDIIAYRIWKHVPDTDPETVVGTVPVTDTGTATVPYQVPS